MIYCWRKSSYSPCCLRHTRKLHQAVQRCHAFSEIHANAYAHPPRYTYIIIRTHACTDAHTHARTHAHTRACTHARMHARTRTHARTHTHTHTPHTFELPNSKKICYLTRREANPIRTASRIAIFMVDSLVRQQMPTTRF